MSHTYAGLDAFPTTITLPDDGDPAVASAWDPAYEGLANRTIWLRNRMAVQQMTSNFQVAAAGFTTTNAAPTPVTGVFGDGSGVTTIANVQSPTDMVYVTAFFHLSCSSPHNAILQIEYSENGAGYVVFPGGLVSLTQDGWIGGFPYTVQVGRPVGATGPFAVRMQLFSSSAGNQAGIIQPATMRIDVLRVLA